MNIKPLSIKKKLIISTVLSLVLFVLVIVTGWIGNRSMSGAAEVARDFEKEAMVLQMLFRGVNETILTDGTPYSIAITSKGVVNFDELHRKLMAELDDPEIIKTVKQKIDPRWQRIKNDMAPFLRLNSVSRENDALMIKYGKLLTEGEVLINDVQALSEQVQAAAGYTAKKTQQLIFFVVFSILLGMTFLHFNLYRSIAVPINRLRELMTDVSESKGDLSVSLNEKARAVLDEFSRSETRLASRVSDIQTLVKAFAAMADSINGHIVERDRILEELEKLATTDKLTQSLNRTKFDEIIGREMERSRRFGHPLSVILFDMDHFKRVNDTYGHIMGDHVLATIAALVKANIRGIDYLVRWGGEEFLIIAPEIDLEETELFSERLRNLIENYKFDKVGMMTSSFGVAQFRKDDSKDAFVQRADEALYAAKAKGRNRVEVNI